MTVCIIFKQNLSKIWGLEFLYFYTLLTTEFDYIRLDMAMHIDMFFILAMIPCCCKGMAKKLETFHHTVISCVVLVLKIYKRKV